jgi:hypothetical protein
MKTSLASLARMPRLAPVLAAGLLALSSAHIAAAQGAPDVRWQAWIGCWEPADAPGTRIVGSSTAPRTCVTSASGTSAVQIATVIDGRIVDRNVIDASGKQFASTRDGCNGWESAQWSASGDRLYVRSEYICQGGLKRTTNGLMAMSPAGEWLDVQNVASGTNKGVRVVRLRTTTDTTALPTEIAESLRGRALALTTARMAAATTLTGADIVDATKNTEPAVVEAWLVERGQAFLLDAKLLTTLADAGVPGSVTDVMVALSYPKVFALNPSTRTSDFRATETGDRAMAGNRTLTLVGYDALGYPLYGYGPYVGYSSVGRCGSGFSSYAGLYYSPYAFGCGYGYSGYGYGGYGYGYGYGGYGYGYGWYPGGGPIVVVVGGGTQVAGTRPRVVNGRGYSSGSTGGSGSSSTPRSTSGSSTTSSSGGTSGTASSGGSAAAAPARTAHPKP